MKQTVAWLRRDRPIDEYKLVILEFLADSRYIRINNHITPYHTVNDNHNMIAL